VFCAASSAAADPRPCIAARALHSGLARRALVPSHMVSVTVVSLTETGSARAVPPAECSKSPSAGSFERFEHSAGV
jgi:hypothetical protein